MSFGNLISLGGLAVITVIATFITVCLILHLRKRESGERLEIKIGIFELRHGKPAALPPDQDVAQPTNEVGPNDAEPPRLP